MLAASIVTASGASANVNVNIGHLQCNVAPGMGILVTSSKPMLCVYTSYDGRVHERYRGIIRKFGFDLGPTNQGVLIWDVLAPAGGPPLGSLAGEYLGGSASATVGGGLGFNGLVAVLGPSNTRSITLQPLSTQAQTGLNFAAGVASMTLEPEPPISYPAPRVRKWRHHWRGSRTG